MMIRFIIASLLLCTSCSYPQVWVRTEQLSENYLASSQISMPNLCNPPFCGQQLVIKYRALKRPATLFLSIRFADHQIETFSQEVGRASGFWLFQVTNDLYCSRGPILGYKVELYEGDQCAATFSHLWADQIAIEQ